MYRCTNIYIERERQREREHIHFCRLCGMGTIWNNRVIWQLHGGTYAAPYINKYWPDINNIDRQNIVQNTPGFKKHVNTNKEKRLRQTWNAVNMSWGYHSMLQILLILMNIKCDTILVLNMSLYTAFCCPVNCPFWKWIATFSLFWKIMVFLLGPMWR